MPDLPLVGKVSRGWLLVVAGGSAAAIGYVLWRRHKAGTAAAAVSASPAAAATAGDPYPPDGTTGNPSDPNSVDPETGLTYGDEQLDGGGFGGSGFGAFGFPGAGGGGGGGGGGGAGGGPPFTTNAAWATYAEQQLAGIVDPTALSAALGVYLTGRPASSDQVSLIDQAIAIAGYPPTAGPGNNPPGIVQGGGGGGGSAVNPVTGLHQTQVGYTGADIAWTASQGATGYTVTSTAGTASMTGPTSARIHDIGPHAKTATVTVLATPAAAGATPATITVHVK